MNNVITLQDMPDDVLEIIYKHLNACDANSTNIAINKEIKIATLTIIDNKSEFDILPRYFHPYVKVHFKIDRKELDKYRDIYELKTMSSVLKYERLTNLVSLDCEYANIGRIMGLKSLRTLKCMASSKLTDINTLINLTDLDCSHCDHIDRIDRLIRLERLICRNTRVQDVSNLINLKELDCTCSDVTECNMLTKLVKLKSNTVTNFSNLVNLTYLDCSSNSDIQNSDISFLTELKILECRLTELTNIDTLVNLTELNCSSSHISNIDTLVNLTELDCSSSHISDLSLLPKLTSLTYCGSRSDSIPEYLTDIQNGFTLNMYYAGFQKLVVANGRAGFSTV